jgi:hypothetical protein
MQKNFAIGYENIFSVVADEALFFPFATVFIPNSNDISKTVVFDTL